MPVFISYSHQDSAFASELAAQLVKHRAKVWIDQWELHVGDSLIDRIQQAIQGASALIVILSKASINSEWCKKELSSGLLRELEEKRVVVLPALIEECEIPLFLRGKMYADFRTDFDKGLRATLETVSRVTSEGLGRYEEPEWTIDWAIDHGYIDSQFSMQITIVEQAKDQPYSVLTEIKINANDKATARYRRFEEEGIDWIERAAVIHELAILANQIDLRLLLEDEFVKLKQIEMNDEKTESVFGILISARRLGQDTGRDILLNLPGQLESITETQRQNLRAPTFEEIEKMKRIQNEFSPRSSKY
ncbi:MAG: toll/interleukin-1 receptor domain-containing protein [Candidatus Helarchaeota archaeon]